MENYLPEIVDNIKQEPERHFLVVLPDYQESSDELDEILQQTIINTEAKPQINVRKFNKGWKKSKVEMFETFFVCGKCDFVFKHLCRLQQHLLKCKGKEKKCLFCDRKFTERSRKTHELKEHRNGSTWQCSQCPYKTLIRLNLDMHCRSHFKKFSCETCTKKFATPYMLRDHQMMNRHGVYATQEVSRFDCNECGKSFATKNRLCHHKRYVHSKRKFYCDFCGKSFKNKNLMKHHIKSHFKTPCSICRKPISEANMKLHMKLQHSSGESFLACRVVTCRHKFASVEQLNKHESIHIGTRRYKCQTCNYEAKHLSALNDHMKAKSRWDHHSPEIIDDIQRNDPEKRFSLEFPDHQESHDAQGKTLSQSNSITGPDFQVNIRKFNAKWRNKVEMFETLFACGKCDYVSKNLHRVDRHSRNCKGTEYECSFCDQKFSQNGRKIHEVQEHRKGPTWKCNQCPYNTLDRKNLKQHHHFNHSRKFSCETCEKNFACPWLLRDHQMQHRHGVYVTQEVPRLVCNECGKSFASKHRLYKHTFETHSKRNYDCDFCGKSFKYKEYMKRHIKSHFKSHCSICQKPISQANKKLHMKSFHFSGESYLACRILLCQQKFTSVKQLNKHQSIHIDNQRYKCPKCNYEKKSLSDIKQHMKTKFH